MKCFQVLILSFGLFVGNARAMEQSSSQSGYLGEELLSAIVCLEDAAVQSLLDRNADVNYANYYKITPLMCAAGEGNKLICELLIKKGADIFYTNVKGSSALERAASWGWQSVSELLVEKMLSIPTSEQKTRVYAFSQCLKRMCPNQFHNVSDVFKPHLRALILKENTHKACREVCALDESPTKNHLIKKYFSQEELLFYAADAGDEKCVQRLIAEGIGVDDYIDWGKRTALLHAAYMGWGDITELLVDAGADLYQKDEAGLSVLQGAVTSPHDTYTVRPPYELLVEKMIRKDGLARALTEVETLDGVVIKKHLLEKYFWRAQ